MRALSIPFGIAIVLALAPVGISAAESEDSTHCDTLDSCLVALHARTAGDDQQHRDADLALKTRLQSFAPEVVPGLVEALSDANLSVANLAARTLADIPEVDAGYLPEIQAGLDRDLDDLLFVLCDMSGEAPMRELVARYVAADSARHNSEGYALRNCAKRAFPHIIAAARCQPECNPDQYDKLARLMRTLDDSRVELAPDLLAIAEAPETSEQVAIGALTIIAGLEIEAPNLGPDLLKLREARPELANAVEQALIGVRASAAALSFAARLEKAPDVLVLRDLAEIGHAGAGASGVVVQLLHHEDSEIRAAAATTLGFIGDPSAADALIPLLDDPTDARLNWAAADSLGKLQSHSAIDALESTASKHWYPPVRFAAEQAIQHIIHGSGRDDAQRVNHFPSLFFRFFDIGRDLPRCERPDVEIVNEPDSEKRYAYDDPGLAEQLAFDLEGDDFVEAPPDPNEPANNAPKPRYQNFIRVPKKIPQEPIVALQVNRGWLVGSNQGEWGGALAFVSDHSPTQIIIKENVVDIHRFGNQIVALTGLSHMASNEGQIFQLTQSADGQWSAKGWRRLPGAPERAQLTTQGELLIDVYAGGTLILSPSGAFRLAPCDNAAEPAAMP
ncbi:hypothetical protein C7S18_08700 [Ahniella affigens]|uniref:HEAT repeat domain-containing protein n=1 Tax=Ahniella affigens TaxID=2021234 RepID=A0A2P1PQZ0_9GAMM|nr:HEAT repeat domain-containing protein [Ahniella affigens]AVP97267.1 hypothetical protein C7S18_08700 [Ahniella affigens]